jgi:hypothetical protein
MLTLGHARGHGAVGLVTIAAGLRTIVETTVLN